MSFLDNSYEASFVWRGNTYKTVEHAYQAAKTLHPILRKKIMDAATVAEAKSLGEIAPRRGDWEEIKLDRMKEIVRAKFFGNFDLAMQLLQTGNEEIIMDNFDCDNYWGRCACGKCDSKNAKNHLGRILMEIREEIKEFISADTDNGRD